MDKEVLEIAMYRIKPGIDRQRFLEDNAAAGKWLASRPGFLQRTLLEADGQWFDLVRWSSLAAAQAAAAQFEEASATEFANAPELRGLMTAVDPESIAMYHARPVAAA